MDSSAVLSYCNETAYVIEEYPSQDTHCTGLPTDGTAWTFACQVNSQSSQTYASASCGNSYPRFAYVIWCVCVCVCVCVRLLIAADKTTSVGQTRWYRRRTGLRLAVMHLLCQVWCLILISLVPCNYCLLLTLPRCARLGARLMYESSVT